MRWLFIAMLAMPAAAVADAYVAIPTTTSQALYFPNAEFVHCYSAVVNSEPTMVKTDRCFQVFLPSVVLQWSL